jgi:hypothetical protein
MQEPAHPDCLLVQYDVREQVHSIDSEPEMFCSSIEQIRGLGRAKFPQLQYVVIAIFNREEHESVATFSVAYKAAMVYKAADVFDAGKDARMIIPMTAIDRHPVLLVDGKQKWVILERFLGGGKLKR